MKRLALLVAFLPISAFASFDLVYVADEGTDSIHRFDGGTGVYLGAIQGPWSNPRSIVIDQVNNTLFVGAGNGIFQVGLWDNTYIAGEAVSSGPGAAMVAPGKYIFGLTSNTTIGGGSMVGISGWFGGFLANDGAMLRRGLAYESDVLYQSTSTSIRRYTMPTWGGSATLLSSHAVTGGGAMGGLAVGPGYVIASDATANKIHLMAKTGSAVNPYTYSTHSTVTGAAYAHGQAFYLVGRNSADTSGILTLSSDRFIGQSLRTYGTGILQSPTAVAVIIAPEPGTMFALGSGLALLLRRRKITYRR